MSFPWFLSMAVGFLSLSQEILWMRYMGFVSQGMPEAFSFVLTVYLMGIAVGALAGRIACARTKKLYTVSATVLALAAVLDMAGPFLSASVPTFRLVVVPFIFLCAALKSVVFPIAHHLGSSAAAGRVGRSVSRVYFMNILGSSLGPIITGFWLLDYISFQQAMALMAVLTGLLAVAAAARENGRVYVAKLGLVPLVLAVAAFLPGDTLTQQLACHIDNDKNIHRVIETKSGIIHSIFAEKGGGDYTMGGNVYDGRSNVDPRVNSNRLERVFILGALHPQPKTVLVIGMSSGAWSRVLTWFPTVQHIEIVEINPAYLEMIRDYPEIYPFLDDPRVRVNIDDGRRWLKRHPGDKFDLIVMNTTFNWRAYSTNLLSRDFLEMVRDHLNPGGIMTYNTTSSVEALKTAASVFPYAFGYLNFAVVGNQDFRPLVKGGEKRLLSLRRDGKPVFEAKNPKDVAFMKAVVSTPFVPVEEWEKMVGRKGEVITDWNMLTEYKYGRSLTEFLTHPAELGCH